MQIKTTLLSLFLLLALTGCSSVLRGVERLSGALMLNEHGYLNIDSYNLILNRRFPDGTPTQDMLAYVKQQEGKCTQQGDGYACSIYYYATLCLVQHINIRFKELAGLKTIYDLNAIAASDGC